MSKLFPNYPKYIVTSPFGTRIHPVTGKKSMHNGIDLVASKGSGGMPDYITAHSGGTVESVGYSSSAGYYVKIKVSADTTMVYYHLREMGYVKKGACVKAGDKIGYMGKTGTATGVHLHWGIQKNGKWIDPKPYLEKDYEEEQTVNIEMTVLKKGSRGEEVKTLQRLLVIFGYDIGKYGVDGSFGSATDEAVRKYQNNNGLTADGSVGKATWTKILKG